MLDLYYKIFRRGRCTDYQRVYSWYEEKRDECEQLRGELAKAAGEILGLKNELHTRKVMNEHIKAVYEVHPPMIVSNHTVLGVVVQARMAGASIVQFVPPYTQYALAQSEHVEIVIVEKKGE